MARHYVTALEAVKILSSYTGHGFARVVTHTYPKLLKKSRVDGSPCPWPTDARRLSKLAEYTCQLGVDFRKVVAGRQVREGVDPADHPVGTSWHVPYQDCKTIRAHPKTGELYFYVFLTAASPASTVRYVCCGNTVDAEKVKPFLPIKRKPGNQGLDDNAVEVRTLKLDSLVTIKFDGDKYVVVD